MTVLSHLFGTITRYSSCVAAFDRSRVQPEPSELVVLSCDAIEAGKTNVSLFTQKLEDTVNKTRFVLPSY